MDGIGVLLARLDPDALFLAVCAEGEELVGVRLIRTDFELCLLPAGHVILSNRAVELGCGEFDAGDNSRLKGCVLSRCGTIN